MFFKNFFKVMPFLDIYIALQKYSLCVVNDPNILVFFGQMPFKNAEFYADFKSVLKNEKCT
jgi:hypothetical protein